jgi:hypothetical protein
LGLLLVFAIGAGTAGAVLGLLRQPDPQNQLESFAWTAAAAIETARHAEDRARVTEKALADARSRIHELSEFGAAQELADDNEAEHLGVARFKQLMDRFDGDLTQALIAYNAGPGVARSLKRGSKAWRRLEAYPKSVLAAYKALLLPQQQLAAR